MAWTEAPDGSMRCDAHGAEPVAFAKGRSCPTCATAPVTVEAERIGPYEALSAEAAALGRPDRLRAEAMVYEYAAELMEYARKLEQRAEQRADDEQHLVATHYLSAAARYRSEAGKLLREMRNFVFDRERRADAERFERLFTREGRRRRSGQFGPGKERVVA